MSSFHWYLFKQLSFFFPLSSGYQWAPEEWNEHELFIFELCSVQPVSKLARQLRELRSWSAYGALNRGMLRDGTCTHSVHGVPAQPLQRYSPWSLGILKPQTNRTLFFSSRCSPSLVSTHLKMLSCLGQWKEGWYWNILWFIFFFFLR